MPSRIHWAGKNNRSQHNLVGSTGAEDSGPVPVSAASPSTAGAANPSSASRNPTLSSSDSSQPDASAGRSNHTQPPPPPPHLVNVYGNPAGGSNPAAIPPQLQHSNSVAGAFDSRRDFADQVTRSQSHSHRYTQSQISPTSAQLLQQQQEQLQQLQEQQQQQQQQLHHQTQQEQHPPLGSASVEDLSAPGLQSVSSPILGNPHSFSGQQPPQPQPQKSKQSTRRLIRNILRGQDHSSQSQHNPYSSTPGGPGPARRNSKRVSLPPPAPPSIHTSVSQLSQVSLDQQQQYDWQNQAPPTQPSPLQGNPHDIQQPTIRTVPPSDADSSPYPAEDIGYRQHRGHGQSPSALQHQQYGQGVFEAGPQQQPQQYQFAGSQQQYQFSNPQRAQYQASSQPGLSGHLGNPQQQNPETVSQLSHDSPAADSDQRSATNIQTQTAQTAPAINYSLQTQDPSGRPNQPSVVQAQTPQQQNMAPPAGGPPPARRSQDTEKGTRDQVQPPPGPPPNYRQSQQPNMNPLPQPPSNTGVQSPNFRQNNVPDRQQFDGQGEIQGRNSPQPTADRGAEDPDKAFKDLLTKYKNVKRLYFDGKKEIEQLSSQVEQLQNAIANQRMSQSRTSLDDNEYTTRFNRLNGAINNLSFNIRKDWVTLPSWLVPFVSADALKTGKQEMTAVGRAVITRWIVEEIFNCCFHPGLDPELSRQLKAIEHNIRHFSYTMNSQEEFDALTTKVVNWRMATLEGLQDVLRSGESVNHRNDFTRRATSNLTAWLFKHLTDPPPAGVDGSASTIVELAVGIASNLPLESRDVAIIYPLPEQPIQPELMEVEKTGLPSLESRTSDASEEGTGEDGGAGNDGSKDGKDRRGGDKSRTGMLSVMGGGGSAPGSRKGSVADTGMTQAAPPPPKDPGKVRFAGFVAVEVRGRQVLVKAPVWTLG
ncbi:hypothetical protein VTK56DRAFT_6857 [Thermocarpiscus australiensis]